MTTSTVRAHLLVSYALRGALVGLGVYGTLYVAWRLGVWVARRYPDIDGPSAFASIVMPILLLGVLISPVIGLLVAWAARLRRPLAVSLTGLLTAGLPFCIAGHTQRLLHSHLQTPLLNLASVLPVVLVLAYAVIAVLFAPSTRSWLPRTKRYYVLMDSSTGSGAHSPR